MREQFVNNFITQIFHDIPDLTETQLKAIQSKLFIYVNDYDINKRETSIVPYDNYLPENYKIYFVSRKIEGLSQKTLDLYNLYLNDFFFTVNKPLEKITSNDIRVYLYQIQEQRNISNRTLDSRRAAIYAFFEWSTNEEYIMKNPCRSVRKINYERTLKEPLNDIELEKVRVSCETIREKALVEFLYSSGARVTEASNIKISDIDFNKREVALFGKGNKHRKSYINAKCVLYLHEYLNTRKGESEYVFISERHPYDKLKKEAIERIIKTIGKRAKLERTLTPHLFRHTLATDLLNRGTPITEVQKILGHENINTTTIYAKVSNDDIKNSHSKYIK